MAKKTLSRVSDHNQVQELTDTSQRGGDELVISYKNKTDTVQYNLTNNGGQHWKPHLCDIFKQLTKLHLLMSKEWQQ